MLVLRDHLCTHSREGGVLSHSTDRVFVVRNYHGSHLIWMTSAKLGCHFKVSCQQVLNSYRNSPETETLSLYILPYGPQGPRSLAGLWFSLWRLLYCPPQKNQKSNNMETSWSKNVCSVRKMASKWWLLDQFIFFAGVVALAGIVFALIFVTLSLWLAFLKGKLLLLLFIHMMILGLELGVPIFTSLHKLVSIISKYFVKLSAEQSGLFYLLFQIVHDLVCVVHTQAISKRISPKYASKDPS